MGTTYFLYGVDTQEDIDKIFKPLPEAASLHFESIEQFLVEKKGTVDDRVIVYGEVDEIKEVMQASFVYGFTLAIVAKPSQRYLRYTFEIPKDPQKALKTALEGEVKELDLIYCNDEIVLWSALIGQAPPHSMLASLQQQDSRFNRIVLLLKSVSRIFQLKKVVVKLKTFKEQEITTAVSGIVIVAHDDHSCASALASEYLALSKGKMVALLISPSSVIAYIGYLYKAIFHRNRVLPKAVGVVVSEGVEVEADPALEIQIDGKKICTTPAGFTVHKKALKLSASKAFWEKEASRQGDDKEIVKLGALPNGKDEVDYSQKHIPFFPHADTARYQELFTSLREEARVSSTYVVLIVLSTLLAAVGLFLNSASVIIGAMLLAPLMQPIVSFSMGLLRFDMGLFWNGLRSVLLGVLLVLGTAMILAYLLPFETVTPEMAGRLHPTLLDLIVAIVSGIAAAYAKNNPKIIGSLAGVSIAVALVPPIATAGIGLGWQQWSIFQNAFLLFLTNFAGIVFAAALTFMVLGFSAVKKAGRGLLISTAALLAISVPLYFSFTLMVRDAKIKEQLQMQHFEIAGHSVEVEQVQILHRNRNDTLIVRIDVVSDATADSAMRQALKAFISKRIAPFLKKDEKLVLELSERIRY
jgi:uncharacterized hydrophobic protein (TIGR00271 family)